MLKEYTKKYAEKRPHRDSENCFGGKTKCGKSVEFDSSVKEANIMEQGDPISKKPG